MRKRKVANKKHWSWAPGTKVLVISGDYEGKIGKTGEYDPFKNQFFVHFDDKNFASLKPGILREVSDEKLESEDNIIIEDQEDQESPPQEDLHPVEIEYQEKQSEIEIISQETPRETLLRLCQRPEGVTLEELSEARCIGKDLVVKGPFQKTLTSAFKKGLIRKNGKKRKGEEIYVLESEDENHHEETDLQSSLKSIDIQSSDELGDFFIALGRLIKSKK